MVSEQIIPLFPLGLVLLPQMSLPLHIFEERYKQMIKECLEQSKTFGVVYFIGKQFQTKGCSARIVDILKRYDDGRLDIMTRGERRFTIEEVLEEKPYLEARVEFFDDHPEENTAGPTSQRLAQRCIQLLKQINVMTEQYQDEEFSDRLDTKSVSFLAAACDGFSYPEKQQFLEMTATRNRLQKAAKALEKLLQRLRLTREIERIIGGNGNLPESLQQGLKQK